MPPTDGQVLAQTPDFAQWREARVDLGTGVQEVTFLGVVVALEIANENVVVGGEGVVHAGHVARPDELGGRIPVEYGAVEAVAQAVVVGRREGLQRGDDLRIGCGSVGEDVVAVHTVGHHAAAADRHARFQGARNGVDKRRRIARYAVYLAANETEDPVLQ